MGPALKENVKHPLSVTVWGIITINGPGPFYLIEKIMRKDQYKGDLDAVALPYFDEIGLWKSSFTFM